MKRRLSKFATSAALIVVAFAALASARAQDRAASDLPEATFEAIVRCLSRGNEIVMAPSLACVARQAGPDSADGIAERAHMPLGERDWDGGWDKVCAEGNDPRRLPAEIIKRVAANKDAQIAPSGIRIIGAVFCGTPHSAALDLAGLDLPYSLVIDRSVVNGHIDARNLRIKGDFSFDNAVILGSLRLNRARVEGSVYGARSFMKRLFVSDTQVNGSWTHPDSVIFSDAQFLRAGVSGDLSINGSAFSRLWVLSSHIAGTLDLNDTEARCGYHVNSSTAGYVTANQAGFGMLRSTDPDRLGGYRISLVAPQAVGVAKTPPAGHLREPRDREHRSGRTGEDRPVRTGQQSGRPARLRRHDAKSISRVLRVRQHGAGGVLPDIVRLARA